MRYQSCNSLTAIHTSLINLHKIHFIEIPAIQLPATRYTINQEMCSLGEKIMDHNNIPEFIALVTKIMSENRGMSELAAILRTMIQNALPTGAYMR